METHKILVVVNVTLQEIVLHCHQERKHGIKVVFLCTARVHEIKSRLLRYNCTNRPMVG